MKKAGMSIDIHGKECIRIDFSALGPSFEFTLGRVNYSRAHQPLENHIHKDMMEIVLIVKGRQVYQVNGKDYTVNSGEVFVTLPNELHGSSSYPEDKSILYYLIIALNSKLQSFIGFDCDEAAKIINDLNNLRNRKFPGSQKLRSVLDALISVFYGDSGFKKTLIRDLISRFLIDIIACEKCSNYGDSSDMKAVLEYVRGNIKEDISVPVLAEIAGLSVPGFKAKFRSTIGIPPREYVLRQKIEIAKDLLKSSDMSITDIAHGLSFSSSQYFSTVFKRYTYESPVEYRKCKASQNSQFRR